MAAGAYTNIVQALGLGIVYIALAVLLVFLTIVIATLFVEILAAGRNRKRTSDAEPRSAWPRVAVLVPAHNESIGLIPTLADAQSQLRPTDRLLVVADNCDDDTAEVARTQGAEVFERRDPERRGKGYALSAGVAHLSAHPPDIVVIVDADCRISPGAIEQLAATCAAHGRATQSSYLMSAPTNSALNYNVAEFAWRVKNFVRPLGLLAFGLPCQLTGSGMAFPWLTIISAKLATGNIVEDMALGVELAIRGEPALFCPQATLTSTFPVSKKSIETQRRRWEQGHFQTIVASAGPLLLRGAANRSFAQIALALDLAVPPLSALTLTTLASVALCYALLLLGLSAAPLYVAAADALILIWAVALAWLEYGQDVLPLSALPKIAPYLIDKVRVYQSILRAKGPAHWTPTDRN